MRLYPSGFHLRLSDFLSECTNVEFHDEMLVVHNNLRRAVGASDMVQLVRRTEIGIVLVADE